MMTWDEAERLHRGCSAEWDVECLQAIGIWTVRELFENAAGGLTLYVRSTTEEFPDYYWRKDEKGAYFVFYPTWPHWKQS